MSLRERVVSQVAGDAARWQTWYRVDSNVRRPGVAPRAEQALDVALLPGVLAQAAGAPLDPWLAANVVARERCQGLLTACATPGSDAEYFDYLRRGLGAFGRL